MDESGDLSDKGNYFIMTFLVSEKRKPIELIAKRTFKSLSKKIKSKHCEPLHCSEERNITRKRMLKYLAETTYKYKDIFIYCMILEKEKYKNILIHRQNFFYNDITATLLNRIFQDKIIQKDQSINFIASQCCSSKYLKNLFKNYILKNVKCEYDLNITIDMPHKNKSLQVVDFVSWSLFRKYEFDDERYYEIIRNFIKNTLFYNKKIR